MQTRQTQLQKILIEQIEYYLTELNPVVAAHASFIEQKRSALGKEGRERAYKYKRMIEHAEDDYSLARRVYNDAGNMENSSSISLRGSTVLRQLMLEGLCEHFNISADKIRERAEHQRVTSYRAGSAGRHFVPQLDLRGAAFVLIYREMSKMREPKEMRILFRRCP